MELENHEENWNVQLLLRKANNIMKTILQIEYNSTKVEKLFDLFLFCIFIHFQMTPFKLKLNEENEPAILRYVSNEMKTHLFLTPFTSMALYFWYSHILSAYNIIKK